MNPIEKLKDLFENSFLTQVEIQKILSTEHSISFAKSEELLYRTYTKAQRKAHCAKLNHEKQKRTRLGNLNPNWQGGSKINDYGYLMRDVPEWYSKSFTGSSIGVHIIVYCETHNLTEIPEGYVVHHIDLDKLNNDPSNLRLMTVSDHMKLHWELRRKENNCG